jgi:hypothetical protein
VGAAQAHRRVILEVVHRVGFFGTVQAEVLGAMHEMIVALAAFQSAIDENAIHVLPVKR